MQDTIHATAIDYNGHGILLRGASNSGKSSIALRLLEDAERARQSCFLVADDRVILHVQDGMLKAEAPETLFGQIEVRGVGVLTLPARRQCTLDLIVDLVEGATLDRIPSEEMQNIVINGVSLPRLFIAERNPDACTIIRTFLTHGLSHRKSTTDYA